MPTRRQEQVADVIRREVSDLLLRATNDPRIGFASITEVTVSPDLRHARLYVSVLGDEHEQRATMDALIHARGYLRHELAGRTTFKFLPDLTFEHDTSLERGDRLLRLIDSVRKEETAVRPPEPT